MLIECVPNVSEGRRSEVVEAIAAAIRRVPGVRLLDYSADRSHNRSVFTFVGDAPALTQAVIALVGLAVALIDLTTHTGEHPRIGAVDVVPFVPIEGATMADCVGLARSVGAAIAHEFAVPVYLYEAAASTTARTHLENIRRGGFEALAVRMASAEWTPDFGPTAPHPTAGATVVGARMPLIAYNINLASDRLEVARRIARVIRSSNGGLPHVKAMGVRLQERGIVQVSMNLTNYEQTSLAQVFDLVKTEAARDNVEVLESEIVGLVPGAALVDAARHYLRLERFTADQVLERTLARER